MDPEKTKFYSAAYVEGRLKATQMRYVTVPT